MDILIKLFEQYGPVAFSLVVNAAIIWKVISYLDKKDTAAAENQRRDDERNDKLIDMLGGFKDTIDENRLSNERIHDDNITTRQSAQKIIDNNTQALEGHTEGIQTMSDRFASLETAVTEALETVTTIFESGVKLSPETKAEIIAELTANLKTTMTQCLDDAIKATQETPATSNPKETTEQEK